MKRFLLVLCAVVFHSMLVSQPKMVVVIVLDQFPQEYLTRFGPYFSHDGGFEYLLSHGASFVNAQYEHAYTKTAPGHTALLSGAYGHYSGIIANHWYDRAKKKIVGCVDDETEKTLFYNDKGKSPRTLQTYTFGDMLKLHSHFQSRVISLSNKDRSAVLMGGKFGTAYWVEDSSFVSSTYYMRALPVFMQEFNNSGIFQRFFGKAWTELQPATASRICDVDDAPYEESPGHLGRTFPHLVTGESPDHRSASYYDDLVQTPFAETILLEAAKKACAAESLGLRNGITDLLCVGVSSTDEIGHPYGPDSHEVFDMALRTDAMLGDFLRFLDKHVGLDNCVIALSSDHGIPPIPEYLKKTRPGIEAGRVGIAAVTRRATEIFERVFPQVPQGSKWLSQVVEGDVYLNRDLFEKFHIPLDSAADLLRDSLPSFGTPFAAAYTQKELRQGRAYDKFAGMVARSCYPARSGDVMYIVKPYYLNMGDSAGTTHGEPYAYDTHVPLILMGKSIAQGVYQREVHPTDLAPTLSAILGVELPPNAEGKVLEEVLMQGRSGFLKESEQAKKK
jgi:predicted AlkP superfamily pyrophosphatase or phosphodiesterase